MDASRRTPAERSDPSSARRRSRRQALLALASLLPFGVLLRALDGERRTPLRERVRGPIPEGSSLSGSVALWRAGDTIEAVSLRCTHLGCLLRSDGQEGLACPCHGSRFDAKGRVKAGPAQSALARLPLAREGREDVVVELPA